MPSLIDKSGNIDYFARLSWGNLLDWMVTGCLGAIIALFTVSLGGVRADTHLVLLPLFSLLLVLHGVWLAVDDESPKRLSQVPLFMAPFLIWAAVNVNLLSPTPWLGQIELIYAAQAFIFYWVLVNNVRTRAHLWTMFVLALSPAAYAIFIGFFQFFQNPNKLASALADHGIRLSREFLGQATGSFADPNSFAIFLLVWLPSLLIAGLVPRLPMVHRVLCLYVALMFMCAIAFTQLFWPILVLILVLVLVSIMCFQKLSKRVLYPAVGAGLLLAAVSALILLHPVFANRFAQALSNEGEAVRLELMQKSVALFLESPIQGVGGGAFSTAVEQSSSIQFAQTVQTPHNDFLLLLTEYGVVGFILFILPIVVVLFVSLRSWKREPARVKLKDRNGSVMPPQRFFLSVGLSSFLVFLACAFGSFVFYVPALMLYGVLFFSILVKSGTTRRLVIGESRLWRWMYVLCALVFAFVFYVQTQPRMEAHAIELQMRQRLDHLIEKRVHVSGRASLLDNLILKLEDARILDPTNADVWIGLSAAHCQRYYQNPSDYEKIAKAAVGAAQKAVHLSDRYAKGWAQLGVAYALSGDGENAESAFTRALELSPNSSHVHYYWAAYLSHQSSSRAEALRSVNKALLLNPNNSAARRLQQKLLIL